MRSVFLLLADADHKATASRLNASSKVLRTVFIFSSDIVPFSALCPLPVH